MQGVLKKEFWKFTRPNVEPDHIDKIKMEGGLSWFCGYNIKVCR